MKKHIERLQFITHDIKNHTQVAQAQLACEGGAKWIQYRCFSKNDEELLKDIHLIAAICDDWGATLIVTDHIHLKDQADIQGFHIEDMAADFKTLRENLGDNYTLGGSANTFENLIRLAAQGADYAGFGPFKSTTTKPNTLPLITLTKYAEVIQQLADSEIDFPVLAVGGIQLADVESLINTGVSGIAVSGAVTRANDLTYEYEQFYRALY